MPEEYMESLSETYEYEKKTTYKFSRLDDKKSKEKHKKLPKENVSEETVAGQELIAEKSILSEVKQVRDEIVGMRRNKTDCDQITQSVLFRLEKIFVFSKCNFLTDPSSYALKIDTKGISIFVSKKKIELGTLFF